MDDITVGCTLPPRVSGDIYGDILLYIPELETVAGNTLPTETHVRCRWWGEKKPGSLFRPMNKRSSQHVEIVQDPTNTVLYPIIAKQTELKSYFEDMVRFKSKFQEIQLKSTGRTEI